MSIVTSDTSVTHTFGNVACLAMNYIKDFFPDDFFRTEHISTKIAYQQLNVFRSRREFWKNEKPMLILKPRIEIDDSSVGYYGSALMNRVTNSKLGVEFANTVPVIVDEQYGVMLRFGWNRFKIYYDVAIVVQTYNEQLNIMYSLKNKMVPLAPFMLRADLEACIPKGIIKPIQKHLGTPEEDTAEITKYLNTYGSVPFTYKLKNASGTNEYFMLYGTNVEVVLSDISADDGENIGMITDTYTIGLSMSFEFNAPGSWYVFLKDNNPNFIANPTDSELEAGNKKLIGERIVPLLSIPLQYNLSLDEGWKILQSPTYMVTSNGIGPEFVDETDFSQVIPKAVQNTIVQLIKHNKEHGIPISPYIRFRCFKDTKELPVGYNGFKVDLENFKIYTYNCKPKVTYRLFILINNLAIQNLMPQVQEFHKEK